MLREFFRQRAWQVSEIRTSAGADEAQRPPLSGAYWYNREEVPPPKAREPWKSARQCKNVAWGTPAHNPL